MNIMNKDKHESIIISTDHKNALLLSLIAFLLMIALKWFVIGYWMGKKEDD